MQSKIAHRETSPTNGLSFFFKIRCYTYNGRLNSIGCDDADIEMVDSNADEVDVAETRGDDS